MLRHFTLTLTCLCLPAIAGAQTSGEICVYQNAQGQQVQTNSRNKIPGRYRREAQCMPLQQNIRLAAPEEIDLGGAVRREDLSTSLGRVKARWPRTVETLFGRTPLRALTDAANTVSRTVKTSAFPIEIQNLNAPWNVVFLDEQLPEAQIPYALISNCHPGWMTPPANIYLVAQRIAAGCGNQPKLSSSMADAMLTRILLHEMGHAVEFYLLGASRLSDRAQAEGFATWFEVIAAQNSSILRAKEIERDIFSAAKVSLEQQPNFTFSGSANDYARSSMYFFAVSEKFGTKGVMDIYALMRKRQLDLFTAIQETTHWNKDQVEREVARLLQRR